jgi:hypothetical protein
LQQARLFALGTEQLQDMRLRIIRSARAAIHDEDHRNGIVSAALGGAIAVRPCSGRAKIRI